MEGESSATGGEEEKDMILDAFRSDKGRALQTIVCSGLVTFCNQPGQGLGPAWLELDKPSGFCTCYSMARTYFIFWLGTEILILGQSQMFMYPGISPAHPWLPTNNQQPGKQLPLHATVRLHSILIATVKMPGRIKKNPRRAGCVIFFSLVL